MACAPVACDDIRFFFRSGEFAFLSNFYAAPIVIDGETWPTTEAFFQASKYSDPKWRSKIQHATTPAKAKALGRAREGFVGSDLWVGCPGRPGLRVEVMATALRAKFTQNEGLHVALLSTGARRLVEDTGDSYWGCGRDGRGQNRLGELLMQLRDDFRRGARCDEADVAAGDAAGESIEDRRSSGVGPFNSQAAQPRAGDKRSSKAADLRGHE